MYIFNNIELLIALGDTRILESSDAEIYVTEMVIESNSYEYYIRNKLKFLQQNGILKTFSLGEDFYQFALIQQIKYPGLDIMAFACIFFSLKNMGYLVTSNPTIKKCAISNNVSVPEIKDILTNLLKEEQYVELFMNI